MTTPSSTGGDAHLRQMLEQTTLADLVAKKDKSPIAAIESDEPVASLLTLLASRRVLAAPVLIRSTGDPPGAASLAKPGPPIRAVAGFVGAADVVDALIQELGAEGLSSVTPGAIESAAGVVCARPVGSLLSGGGGTTTVGAVRESTAGRDWGVAGAPGSTPLLDALAFHFFKAGPAHASPGRPVHRLAVFDALAGANNGGGPPALTAILSQSDVVAALAAAPLQDWGGAANAPADAAATPGRSSSVVSVPADTPALAAFATMRSAGVPGVAVVDPTTGALTGHLSASDARVLSPGTFGALSLPVSAFLAQRPLLAASATDTAGGAGALADVVAKAAAAGTALLGGPQSGSRAARLLTAVPGLGLRPAAAALAASRVHQLYEIDGEGKPVRVVSVSDVLGGVLAAAGGAPA